MLKSFYSVNFSKLTGCDRRWLSGRLTAYGCVSAHLVVNVKVEGGGTRPAIDLITYTLDVVVAVGGVSDGLVGISRARVGCDVTQNFENFVDFTRSKPQDKYRKKQSPFAH